MHIETHHVLGTVAAVVAFAVWLFKFRRKK